MMKLVQHHSYFLSILIVFLSVNNAIATEKVVVVPLSSNKIGPSVKRTISVPANALMYSTLNEPTITPDAHGLRWQASISNAPSLTIKAPSDYAGGDVVFYIFFETTTSTAGKVDFFLRPTSLGSGDGIVDPGSINSTAPVDVSGKIAFGTVYQQSFLIPEDRLSGGWWTTSMQRHGAGETYTDDVIVRGIAFEYQAVQ